MKLENQKAHLWNVTYAAEIGRGIPHIAAIVTANKAVVHIGNNGGHGPYEPPPKPSRWENIPTKGTVNVTRNQVAVFCDSLGREYLETQRPIRLEEIAKLMECDPGEASELALHAISMGYLRVHKDQNAGSILDIELMPSMSYAKQIEAKIKVERKQ